MPNYGSKPCISIGMGESLQLFAAESPAAPQASISCCLRPTRSYTPLVFYIEFAAAPTDSLKIQGAMTDTDADYTDLFTSTNTQKDIYTDQGSFAFYRARLATQTGGGAVTVTVRR